MSTLLKFQNSGSLRGRTWVYVAIAFFNLIVFCCIFGVYISNSQASAEKLYNENLNNISNLNAASANAAENYISNMSIKLDDVVGYIGANDLGYDEVVEYLGQANSDYRRSFQLILSSHYKDGAPKSGDYTGVSVRREPLADGSLKTVVHEISYQKNYTDLTRSLDDLDDDDFVGECTAQEFTDADTKLKSFAPYRHVVLDAPDGTRSTYTILMAVNSKLALQAFNLQTEYEGQSAVLINSSGDYIIKSADFKGLNFYEYLQTYNDLTLDEKNSLRQTVLDTLETSAEEHASTNLFYKNHEDRDSVFCIAAMPNSWYSITCVPLDSFKAY